MIPNWAAIAIVVTLLIALVTWMFRLEWRIGTLMVAIASNITRKEHEEICEKQQTQTRSTLSEMKMLIERNHRDATTAREKVDTTLASIHTTVAVMEERTKNLTALVAGKAEERGSKRRRTD
jgi:hypothetical protein